MPSCTKCGLAKEDDAFRLHPNRSGNRFSWCKPCENREKTLRNRLKIKESLKLMLWTYAKRRAAKQSLPFDLDPDDISVPSHCPVLGMELKRNVAKPGRNSFSLDRTDPKLGYVRGNITVMSVRANLLKSDATPEELAAILEKVHGWTCSPPV